MFVCFPAFRSVWGLWFRRQAEICHALIMVVEKTVVIMIAAKAGLLKPCVFSTSTIEPISGWFPRWGRGKSVDALIFEHLWNRWRSECMPTMLPYVTYKWMYLGSHKLQPSPFRVGNKHQTTSIDRSKQWLPIPKLRGNRLNSCGSNNAIFHPPVITILLGGMMPPFPVMKVFQVLMEITWSLHPKKTTQAMALS